MNKQLTTLLKYLLSGVLVFTIATAHAQDAGNPTSDSTRHHRNGMHRWGNSDSTHHFNRDGWANRGGDPEGHGRSEGQEGRGHFGPHQSHGQFGPHRQNFAHRGFGRGYQGHFGSRLHIHYTPEQRQQLMAINKEYRQKREDLFKQDNLTLKQYKAGLVALEKEKKSKTQGLLTQQQKDELAANRKRMDENRQVREVAHLERLKLHLALTDDQVAKIRAGNENWRSQAKAIHENDNLLPQQKMEQMKTLMAKRNDTYKSVLTPDQYTLFEKMMSHRRAGGGFRGSRTI